MIVIEYLGAQPKKPQYRLYDDEGKEVPVLLLSKWSPVYFAAKDSLRPKTAYRVEIAGEGGWKHEFKFTTR